VPIFKHQDTDLNEAQLAKKRHLAAKLQVSKGEKLLDIGCGWGGLGLYFARVLGADVTGVTLSHGHCFYYYIHYRFNHYYENC